MNRVTISLDTQGVDLDVLESRLRDACYHSQTITIRQTDFLMGLVECMKRAVKRYDKYAEYPTFYEVLQNAGVKHPLPDAVNIMTKKDKALSSARIILEVQTGKVVEDIELEDGSYKNFNVLYKGDSQWHFVRL